MMSRIARLLLGIPATSVESERTWSEAKLIDTRLRSQLGDDIYGDLIVISKNLPENGDMQEFIDMLTKVCDVPLQGLIDVALDGSDDDN